uniref:Uncharacterized protein n=1 Tax=Anguilla anguilla TaxID=7936 RepID=A0A0E9WE59_ANGAN
MYTLSGSRKGRRTYLQTDTSVFLRETNTSTIFTLNSPFCVIILWVFFVLKGFCCR